jgi:hypothetical protein
MFLLSTVLLQQQLCYLVDYSYKKIINSVTVYNPDILHFTLDKDLILSRVLGLQGIKNCNSFQLLIHFYWVVIWQKLFI